MKEELPRLKKSVLAVSSLDGGEERSYWLFKSPLERLEGVEINRRMVYGRDRATSRLQRLLEIVELS
jgi:hypothetical protein